MKLETKCKVTLSNDGSLISIFIPVELKSKSGRKTIIGPNGQPKNLDRDKNSDDILLSALYKSYKWNKWLENGSYDTVKELSTSLGINSASYVSRILRLMFLAPDIQKKIVEGTYPTNLSLADFMEKFPLLWSEQRKKFNI